MRMETGPGNMKNLREEDVDLAELNEDQADTVEQGAGLEKAEGLGVKFNRDEMLRKKDEAQIEKLHSNIREGYDDSAAPTPAEDVTPHMETVGTFSGEMAVFNKFPEVSSFAQKLIDATNGKNQEGIKKFTNFLTRGYDKDVLENAIKGAKFAQREVYNKALENGGPEQAWKYIKARGESNYLDVNISGDLVEKGKKRSEEFAGGIEAIDLSKEKK